MNCRHCGQALISPFLDLGHAPPSNAYLTQKALKQTELTFPLRLLVCDACHLVQTEDYAGSADLFTEDYAYFSSFSTSWLEHAQAYVEQMVNRFNLTQQSCVVEIASNDGYLLQYVKQKNIPCYGVEPTQSTAAAAKAKGLEIVEDFFGIELAKKLVSKNKQADLIAANNVLAHVPFINDFVSGFTTLLKPQGVATFEFPHLLNMVQLNQFDTVYHEHFSYLSFTTVKTIFEYNGLSVFDVEELPTHGGSLRVYAQKADTGKHEVSERVASLLAKEANAGISQPNFYQTFQGQAENVKNDLLRFLLKAKENGKTVAGYGAAAKGNTLLNFAGVKPDLLPYIVDRNPAKQNKFMPGSHIPILNEQQLKTDKPNYVIILPWNLKDEVIKQLDYIREWGGEFVVAVPKLEVF